MICTFEMLEPRRLLAADLTAALVGTIPSALPLVGDVVTVRVTNIGDAPAVGTVDTTLLFNNLSDPLTTTFFNAAHSTKAIRLNPGTSTLVVLKFTTAQTTLVDGVYSMTAEVDHSNALTESDDSNNKSEAVTVEILPPFVDLSGTIGTLATKPVKIGKKGGTTVVPLNLTNNGNVALKGNTSVGLFVSTDATIGNSDDTAAGSVVLKGINIGATKTKLIKRPAKLPAGLDSGNYYVVAILDPAGSIGESNEGNNSAISATQFSAVNPFVTGKATVTIGDIVVSDGQADAINLGSVVQGLTGPTQTFTVTNSGSHPLTLGTISLPGGFVLDDGLVNTLPVGESEDFTVRLDTAAAGTPLGSLSFTTNDPAHNPFNFPITGTVTAPRALPAGSP